ncbi:hypothetical protein [Microbacterium dauci]|uniref:Uncharacterized protein n=1 Tax=Microbacterium dauci TaxID=3048008 RepID=A0ABT6ZBC9_9MICO|nr:hypothetical protein [Microbacterium sp. LX3-4]MDJ1113248.1 hypothetical protein [Microbacterium sp. LX3-4]
MTPQEMIGLVGIILVFAGTVLTVIATRGKTRADAKTALDARIDARVAKQLEGAWTEIETLKTTVRELTEKDRLKSSAFARILRAIARQWPSDHGPDLDPSDIALIEDTIPPTWLRRPQNPTT